MLIYNHLKDAQEARYIHINKDCVEKAFMSYKQNLRIARIHTGSDKSFFNKVIMGIYCPYI
jgi:hypothetical protein